MRWENQFGSSGSAPVCCNVIPIEAVSGGNRKDRFERDARGVLWAVASKQRARNKEGMRRSQMTEIHNDWKSCVSANSSKEMWQVSWGCGWGWDGKEMR